MIDGLKSYSAMKDSGVAWLGKVPEHWVVRKLKYAVSFCGGGTPSKADASFWGGRIPWVSPKDMTRARITDSLDHITEEAVSASAASIVSPGALLMVVRSGILRRTIPVAINAAAVALNQDMKALRPRAGVVASEYLRALVQGNEGPLIQEWTKQGATVESIEHEFLANSLIPLPPLPEQSAIVRFLDHADRRIRRYIRAKQKLIKLLEEQKQAIIHRAVTRGLDPNVRLKPSGVEWLGDVPEHWEVRPLKFVVPQVTVGIVIQPARLYVSSGIPCLRSLNISSGVIQDRQLVFISPESNEAHRKSQIFAGDIVVVRTGQAGVAAIVTPQFDGANCIDLLIVRASNRLNSKFLLTYLNSWAARTDVQFRSVGAIQAHYNTGTLANLVVPVPPLEEQGAILSAITEESAPLEGASSTAGSEIALLKEYRTRLIADVVTGKLDVREAAARLPQEAEDVEPLDETEALGDAAEDAGDGLDQEPEEAEA